MTDIFVLLGRSLPIGLSASLGLATVFGAVKYMYGDYLPLLPSNKATTQAPDYSYVKPRPTGRINN